MDSFVERNSLWAPLAQRQIEAGDVAFLSSVADAHDMELSGTPSHQREAKEIEHIAQTVAAILVPTIFTSVEKAVTAGMQQIKKELGEHASCLNEDEDKIASIEEELYNAQDNEEAQDNTNKYVLQKLEDFENRSRRSNLWFVGVPESLQ